MLRSLIDLVLPGRCAGCDLPGSDLCVDCRRSLVAAAEPSCDRCGHPWPVPVDSCAQCPRHLDRLRHGVAFDGPTRRVITAFKDRGRRRLAGELARLIVDVVTPPEAALLVPVPASARRLRERGFNPAADIALRLGRGWHVDVDELLVRRGPHHDQRGASASARQRQVRGAFAVPGPVPRRPIVLVDDVMTTGATLAACALELRRAGGARWVGAVTVARVHAGARSPMNAPSPRATIGVPAVQSTRGSRWTL